MMTKTTGEDSENQKRLKIALNSSPEPEQIAEVVQMVREIKPEPAKIKELFRSFNACPRRASAPPASSHFTHIPVMRPRAASQIPSAAPLFPRRRSVGRMPTIEQSPEKSIESDDSKLKKEGGDRGTIERKKGSKGSKPNSNKKKKISPKQLGGKTRKNKRKY